MPAVSATWTPEPSDIEPLPEPGRRFLARMLAHFEFDYAEGLLLIEAAYALANLDAVRSQSCADRTLREAAAMARLEIGWQKQLQGLLAQLKAERP